MKKGLHFPIDKLTNSIEKVSTRESFRTDVVLVSKQEIATIHKKDGWFFNLKKEFKEVNRSIYKLVLTGSDIIQGLVSIEPISDQLYIELHLIESAPQNYGQDKMFAGVAGNLVAFCCKKSFDLGLEGFVAFTAKTNLIDHYVQTLGAELLYGHRMAIPTSSAKKLVNLYYKEYFHEG